MARPLSSEQLTLLIDQQGPALRLYATQWTNAPDDCVQEALIELARQVPAPAMPLAWLYRAVRLRAHNQHRAERRRTRHEQATPTPHTTSPLASVDIRDLLATLAPDTRELVVLRIWGGLTYDEMAAVTGRSSSALHREYQAALEALRERLNETDARPHHAAP